MNTICQSNTQDNENDSQFLIMAEQNRYISCGIVLLLYPRGKHVINNKIILLINEQYIHVVPFSKNTISINFHNEAISVHYEFKFSFSLEFMDY